MLAVVKTKPDVGIELREVPKPAIARDHEILVRVKACGICGSDLHYYDWEEGSRILPLPRVLGHELSGIVEEVGPGVKGIEPGDHVVCDTWTGCGECRYCRLGRFNFCACRTRIGIEIDGGMAELVKMPYTCAYKISRDCDLEEASLLEPFGVALHALERSGIVPGDKVMVAGPGPIGLMSGYLLKKSLVEDVVITGLPSDGKRLALAESLGLIPHALRGETDEIKRLKEMSGGLGFDCVFETTGTVAGIRLAEQLLIPGGKLVLIGIGDGKTNNNTVVRNELTVIGSYRRQPSTWFRAISMLEKGHIDLKPFITHRLPLSRAEEGFGLLKRREAVKVLLIP
mgnify:CR=1 FL=1